MPNDGDYSAEYYRQFVEYEKQVPPPCPHTDRKAWEAWLREAHDEVSWQMTKWQVAKGKRA